MKTLKNKRALMFTIAAAIFVIVMMTIVMIRVEQSRVHGEALVYRVRCDELGSFLSDMEQDLQRAAGISAKRAAVYAVNVVVVNGTPMADTALSLSEMTVNGTFNRSPVGKALVL